MTTGEIWRFSQVKESVVSMDERRYYLDDVESILATIRLVVARDISLVAQTGASVGIFREKSR